MTRHERSHVLQYAALAAVAFAGACATTQIQSSWAKPDIGPLNFRKVVAMAIAKNPDRRRVMEDAMAGEIHKTAPDVQAVPSYTIISDADMPNEARVKEQIDRAGFDGAVMLRVTDVSRQDVYVPGQTEYAPVAYRSFWGYYHYWVPIEYEPSYIDRETNVRVETEVYSTAGGGDLVYSAVSDTVDPRSPTQLVNSVAKHVVADMKEKGLLRVQMQH